MTVVRIPRQGQNRLIPECLEIMDGAVAEAVQVAQLGGIHLDPREEIERVPEVCCSTGANISFMLKDMQRQRKTEIDQTNGAVVRIAVRHGIPSPVIDLLTGLIRGLERAYST